MCEFQIYVVINYVYHNKKKKKKKNPYLPYLFVFLFVSGTLVPFWKGVYSKVKEFATTGFPFRVDPFSWGKLNRFELFFSWHYENMSIHLYIENFTAKNGKKIPIKILIFFIFLLKT